METTSSLVVHLLECTLAQYVFLVLITIEYDADIVCLEFYSYYYLYSYTKYTTRTDNTKGEY